MTKVKRFPKKKGKKKAQNVKKQELEKKDPHVDDAEEKTEEEVSGFPAKADSDDEERDEARKLIVKQNRKNKKSGGFQSMGLSHAVFTGILRKGYKIPTPIQRKTVPIILEGKDMVAMARTGSGKTAAFLIPMFEKLKAHTAQSGARALILSPTRELALQTLKFTKELGKYTGLKAAVILGGDRMEDQFAALHENPDIIIATPGRFMHVIVEMDLKLQSVEYVVFDEADRLFEMGFAEQLHEVLQRLPEARQTLLFSATLPKLLVEFAKAGLHDPTLIRLDVDTKLSEQLQLAFLQCRADDKTAILLYLLRQVIKSSEQAVVFAATKHHVEYLHQVLQAAGMSCAYIFSALDPTARKINIAKFRNKKTMVLVVTDLAARGIDIPLLDNVINFNFPAKPKLFVHRVGRVARAGRTGMAYSLVAPDEMAYVLDLHLFLGRSMNYASKDPKNNKEKEGLLGRTPQAAVDDQDSNLRKFIADSVDLQNMQKVIANAYGKYLQSRPPASKESIRRLKRMRAIEIGIHPIYASLDGEKDEAREQLLDLMHSYKPRTTIFEINSTSKNTAFGVMKTKRQFHSTAIAKNEEKVKEQLEEFNTDHGRERTQTQEECTDADLEGVFSRVVAPKHQAEGKMFEPKKKKKRRSTGKDEENYVSYRPADDKTEKGLSLGLSFENQAASAVLDFTGDDDKNMKRMQQRYVWDKKKKNYVQTQGRDQGNKKKILTESGTWVPASYKRNLYQEWKEKSKTSHQDDDSGDDDGDNAAGGGGGSGGRGRGRHHGSNPNRLQVVGGGRHRGRGSHQAMPKQKSRRSELKPREQIVKERMKKDKLIAFQKHQEKAKSKRTTGKGYKRR